MNFPSYLDPLTCARFQAEGAWAGASWEGELNAGFYRFKRFYVDTILGSYYKQVDHNPEWAKIAATEIENIKEKLKECTWLKDIQHIGSTSVPGISAKPMIDIIVGYDQWDKTISDEAIEIPLFDLGYKHTGRDRVRLEKVINEGLLEVNLWIVPHNSPAWRSRIVFRDYLRDNPEERKNYQELKKSLIAMNIGLNLYVERKSIYIANVMVKLGWSIEDLIEANVIREDIAKATCKVPGKIRNFVGPQAPNSPLWEQRAQEMIKHITEIMPEGLIVDAEHIGSTSIPGTTARACIAINFAVTDVLEAIKAARNTEFLLDWEVSVYNFHVFSITKINPEQSYQIYFITKMQRQWYMKKDFRDYLREHPEEAVEYARLKQSLVQKYPNDLVAYRKGKTSFVLSILRKCGYTMLEELDEPDEDTETWVKGNPPPRLSSYCGSNVLYSEVNWGDNR